uniref:PD-(D/E)XK endonuclease-like domain-containing protein n=1 Tax=Candidatus Methanogaster sp. ANME-2c ERB4 TaxID=2759911 RepID=A0A7G9YNY6_9EURY|nr:hypothetical protein BFOKDAJI_00021 [Methanosarcinales archaeon ANME-2c ERB4]QNO49748.1 hypothetical protein BFOKDAJI_00050 [Methanosarcinales archaeon ANME-2c ERB4]QNO50523.1 hypothetical protein LKCECFIB_00016 [Methanosarcinales archaeon ANME-2c ERB4]QNO50658.1 hypothetical protein FFGHKCHG_00011 [Methanosarcinales archaeon ANME-2c ERB4]
MPPGGHTFKGFIDQVDLIPGTDKEVAIIDYKTDGKSGHGERSRQLLLYVHGFSHLYPEYTVRRLSPELLSKQKTAGVWTGWCRVCEFGGGTEAHRCGQLYEVMVHCNSRCTIEP